MPEICISSPNEISKVQHIDFYVLFFKNGDEGGEELLVKSQHILSGNFN